jgi:hypothetical protein
MINQLTYPSAGRPVSLSDVGSRLSGTFVWLLFVFGTALSPVSDFMSVRALHDGSEGRFSLIIRGGMIAGLLVVLLLRGRVLRSNYLIALLAGFAVAVLSAVYALGQLTTSEFANQIIFIFKSFSFFVCYAALSGMSDRRLAKLEGLVKIVLIIYAVSMIAGAVFSIEMFRSYQAATQIRSGYKGIVYAQNEASALVIVGLAYGYVNVLRNGWRFINIVLVGSLLGASLLIGTKGGAGGALAVACAYLYARHSFLKATMRAVIVVLVLAGVAWTAYMTAPSVRQAFDLSAQYFIYHHDHADGDGLLTIALSGRNVKFANVWDGLADQNYLALLIGGYPVIRYAVEIDAPDLVLVLGLPIFLLYITLFAKRFISGKRSRTVRFSRLFFFVLMAVACTAGHVLTSALISPYLALVAVIVHRSKAQGFAAYSPSRMGERVG